LGKIGKFSSWPTQNIWLVPAEIYIIRHGIEAIAPEAPGLSVLGAARIRRIVRGLVWLRASFDLILCGDDTPSRETALLIARGFELPPPVVETVVLGAAGNVDGALKELLAPRPGMSIAAVGCEPVLGMLAARLIGATRPVVFKKGAACRIEFDPENPIGRLRWLLPPKILREIGRWD
jgi:phosphohistidine phosphatase